jgi:ribosomal protein S18 acetylase RimI-like enzyme
MRPMPGEVTVRAAGPADDDFLRSVFASTRTIELSALGTTGPAAEAFIRMQVDAQARQYDAVYPGARHSIIEVGGAPAGRLIVDRAQDEIRIVDIALLPEFRRRGIGGALVQRLLDEADASGLPVRLHVVHGNDALGFWQRLGFETGAFDGAHIAMDRRCPPAPR